MRKLTKRLISLILVAALSLMPVVPSNAIGAESAIAMGIDVSKWNGAVDWNAVAAQGYTFAFVKLGSSNSGLDPNFIANMNGASAAGLRVGAYVYSYATSVEGAIQEAVFAVNAVKDLTVSFPIVFDIEDKVHKAMDPATLSAMSNAFCMVVEKAGYYPMVYANRNFFLSKLPGVVEYDKWVAQYNTVCDYPNPAIWQASNTGKVAGINGSTDINYLFKDYSSLIIPYGWLNRKGLLYFYENWKMKTGWVDYAGNKYYTNEDGVMQTGWLQLDEKGKRYFREDGIMSVGFSPIAGSIYYFDPAGYVQTGWQDIGGFRYLFDPAGIMQIGWYNDGAHVYHFADNGAMSAGMQAIDGKWYYFTNEGYMQTGMIGINGYKFYFDATGVMQTGWVSDGTNRYYFSPVNGAMATGVQNIDGKVYSFDENGQIQTGFVDIAGSRFYFNPTDGAMQTGWITVGDSRYYMLENGAMATNWQVVDGKWHYFDLQTGAMQAYTWVEAGGVKFFVGLDGVMVKGWQEIGGVLYYFNESGILVTNMQLAIDGMLYQFDENGIGTPIMPAAAQPEAAAQTSAAVQ